MIPARLSCSPGHRPVCSGRQALPGRPQDTAISQYPPRSFLPRLPCGGAVAVRLRVPDTQAPSQRTLTSKSLARGGNPSGAVDQLGALARSAQTQKLLGTFPGRRPSWRAFSSGLLPSWRGRRPPRPRSGWTTRATLWRYGCRGAASGRVCSRRNETAPAEDP